MTDEFKEFLGRALCEQNSRLQELSDEQKKMNEILAVNTARLEEHMRRTNILEDKLVPVEDHVKFINMLVKVLIPVFGLPAVVYYIVLLIKWKF